jgi:hypothetical protein
MDFQAFRTLVEDIASKNPRFFPPEDLEFSHELPLLADVVAAEEALGVKFPQDYIDYSLHFGSEVFAEMLNIYSVLPDLGSYIVNYTSDIEGFLPVSDNGCGDYYGYRVVDGKCEPQILWWDHEIRKLSDPDIGNLFDYLVYEPCRGYLTRFL